MKDIVSYLMAKVFRGKKPFPIPPKEIESIPNIFIPWELFPEVDPDIFRCNQGIYEYWCDHIFISYWFHLSEDEQKDIKRKAPSMEWLDWIERITTSENMLATKNFHERHAIPFDYRFYLKDFMIAYASDKVFPNNASYGTQTDVMNTRTAQDAI